MKAYFFDLDGTLTDSQPGLYVSFLAGLKAVGVPPLSGPQLAPFLGTPLPEMFRNIKKDISGAEIDIGIKAFRRAYEHDGILQNRLYPGVCEMLEAIVSRGGAVWIVTSKPQHYAIQVVRNLGLDEYVVGVIGAGLDENDSKTDLIGRALLDAKVSSRDATMLGDRHYDITGAIQNGVFPVGALWGYGSFDELYRAGCRQFAKSADEFRLLFVEEQKSAWTNPQFRRTTAA
jgi:phosphoglycolate phosphatase